MKGGGLAVVYSSQVVSLGSPGFDSNSPFGFNKLWPPPTANGLCDLSHIMAFGLNELWQPSILNSLTNFNEVV